jgi:hypothetical protein
LKIDFSHLKLSQLPERELLKWYEESLKSKIEKYDFIPFLNGQQSKSRNDIWSLYAYGNEIKVVYIKNAPQIKNADKQKYNPSAKQTTIDSDKRFSQSLSRSRARIFELALCNEFQYFCTFTQDQTKRERFNLSEFRKDFAQMVRNLNKTRDNNSKIKYLLIPEQHKDGAWHMHGLLMGLNSTDLREFSLKEKLPQNIRKTLKSGKKVYNWEKYSKNFGFFTCTEIENKTACGKYITKYVTKDLQSTARENGEHLFFASQGLKGREVIAKNCLDICPFNEWDYENDYVKIKWLSLTENKDN